MKKYLIAALVMIGFVSVFAQTSIFDNNPFNQDSVQSPIFNPYKLNVSHSMGFSAGTSSNGSGFYASRYTNHLKYEFNKQLSMNLDLNLVNYGSLNSGSGFSFDANDDNKTRILPEFSINYQPSKSVSMRLEFRQFRSNDSWFNRTSPWME